MPTDLDPSEYPALIKSLHKGMNEMQTICDEKDAIIAELQDELSDYWWYALQKESGDKGEGWISPYMSEGEYAGPKRRGRASHYGTGGRLLHG